MIHKKYPFFAILFIFLFVFKANLAGIQPEVTTSESTSVSHPKKKRKHRPHVRLITEDCKLDEATHEQIISGVNFLYDFYKMKFGYNYPRNFVVKIRVFGDFKDYKKYQSKVSMASQSNSGFYINSLKEAVVFKGKDEKQFLSVLFHETNHMLLRNRIGDCPKWINEGLAEYFEGIELAEGDVLVRPQVIKDDRVKRWLNANEMPDIFLYLTKSNEEWDRDDDLSPNPRTLAWSFIYFLMSNQNGQIALKDFLNYLAKHQGDPYASIRAIDYFYGGGYIQFEKDWLEWIGDQHNSQVINTQPLVEPKFRRFIKALTLWVG